MSCVGVTVNVAPLCFLKSVTMNILIPNKDTTTKQLTDRLIELQHKRDLLDKDKLRNKLTLLDIECEIAAIFKRFNYKLWERSQR